MSYQDRRALMAAVSLLCVTMPCSAFAQVGPAPVPAAPPVPEPVPGGIPATSGVPQSLRWTEDWGIAADPAYRRDNPLERLRNLPISDPDIRLSIGGEMRYYYQSWTHQNLGASANDANHNLRPVGI